MNTSQVTYPLLEELKIILSESICLSNDGNQVHAGSKALHHLDIERF